MADKSGITWTNATWGPVTGCTKISPACKHCYAERNWARLTHLPTYAGRKFTDVACHPERLDQPLRWKRPRMIFVNSMSDLFHEDVPDEFIDKVFAVMRHAGQHTFQVLTKRPGRMQAYLTTNNRSSYWAHAANAMNLHPARMESASPHGGFTPGARIPASGYSMGDFPGKVVGNRYIAAPIPNVWLGVSIETQETANERIPLLLKTPAAVRFVSAEPLLEPVDLGAEYLATELGAYPFPRLPGEYRTKLIDLLDWVIVGGESGTKARIMHPDWVRHIRDQCRQAGIPFFFKQTGAWQMIPPGLHRGREWMHAFDSSFVRTPRGGSDELDGRKWQELPEVKGGGGRDE